MRPKRYYRNTSPHIAVLICDLYFIGHWKQAYLGRVFGISQGAVSKIVSGQSWA